MALLRTSTFVRGAKMAALPAAYAGRTALGVGRRVGGAPAEAVATEIQRRTVEQLCKTLGELKGGALKLGQALSVFEGVLPEELAKPYRAALNGLQHAAPPLPTAVVERVLAEELGADWRTLVTIEPKASGAASIGQVHKGVWVATGEAVAVKIQYPGVAKALKSDLRQLRRVAKLFSVFGSIVDVTGIIDELSIGLIEELDYTLEAEAQRQYGTAFVDDSMVVVPAVHLATEKVLVTGWFDGEALSTAQARLTPEEADRVGLQLMHAVYAGPEKAGVMHGDPHPGNFLVMPDGRLGVLDFGAVVRLPDGIPATLGRELALVLTDQGDRLRAEMIERGMLAADAPVTTANLLDYLETMSSVYREDTFTFSRAWLRREAVRLANPRSSQHGAAGHLQLTREYVMVHRVVLGVVGLLSQLGATVPMRSLEIRWSPGFREVVAESTGVDEDSLMDHAEAAINAADPFANV